MGNLGVVRAMKIDQVVSEESPQAQRAGIERLYESVVMQLNPCAEERLNNLLVAVFEQGYLDALRANQKERYG